MNVQDFLETAEVMMQQAYDEFTKAYAESVRLGHSSERSLRDARDHIAQALRFIRVETLASKNYEH